MAGAAQRHTVSSSPAIALWPFLLLSMSVLWCCPLLPAAQSPWQEATPRVCAPALPPRLSDAPCLSQPSTLKLTAFLYGCNTDILLSLQISSTTATSLVRMARRRWVLLCEALHCCQHHRGLCNERQRAKAVRCCRGREQSEVPGCVSANGKRICIRSCGHLCSDKSRKEVCVPICWEQFC